MAQVYIDDRPIHSNKEYLQQKQQQYRKKKQFHEFLKKHQFNGQVLPCFRENFKDTKNVNSPSRSHKKTKAQIYEDIKRKNLQKFGEKKDPKKQKNNELKHKKINPLKMTINYKPKSAIVIDTNEYKLTSENQEDQNNLPDKKNKTQLNPVKNDQAAKEKYEKLLNIMQKQRIELERDKQDFQKHKEKLEFKKLIQGEDSIPFIMQIKKSIQQKNKLQKNHKILCRTHKQNLQNEERRHHGKVKSPLKSNDKIDNYANQQKKLYKIQTKILQIKEQKQQIENEVYKNKRNLIESNDITQTKYSLEQVNHIPAYDVESFRDFIDLKTLQPHGNEFYRIALKVFETGLNAKQAKIKLKIQNLDRVKENCEEGVTSVDYKRRYEGQTRITKYNNGWVEVWNPGVQRLMANKELCFKVVWLKNGDIRQQWKDKKLESYYSKSKQVVQLKFNNHKPIYYFVQLNQIEHYNPQNKTKTVMFREGRIQTFSTQEDTMNGFSV